MFIPMWLLIILGILFVAVAVIAFILLRGLCVAAEGAAKVAEAFWNR